MVTGARRLSEAASAVANAQTVDAGASACRRVGREGNVPNWSLLTEHYFL